MEALDKFVSYPPFDYLPVMVTKRERREQSSLDREGFSKGLRETTVVRRKKPRFRNLQTGKHGTRAKKILKKIISRII